MTIAKKIAYIGTELQILNHFLSFFFRTHSLRSATAFLSRLAMAYNSIASLDKLIFTEYVDFGNSQNRFGQLSRSKNDSNYLDVKLKVFKKDDNKEFQLVQNLTMGEADFNQFIGLRNQLVIEAEDFAREEKLSPVLIPTMSKDMDEQLKLSHKVVNVVDRASTKICVTLLRYNVDKPDISYAQVQLVARKKEDEKCEQNVYVN